MNGFISPRYSNSKQFFQIETPARSLTSLFINRDTEVLIAINPQGLYVIDPMNVVSNTIKLGYNELGYYELGYNQHLVKTNTWL